MLLTEFVLVNGTTTPESPCLSALAKRVLISDERRYSISDVATVLARSLFLAVPLILVAVMKATANGSETSTRIATETTSSTNVKPLFDFLKCFISSFKV